MVSHSLRAFQASLTGSFEDHSFSQGSRTAALTTMLGFASLTRTFGPCLSYPRPRVALVHPPLRPIYGPFLLPAVRLLSTTAARVPAVNFFKILVLSITAVQIPALDSSKIFPPSINTARVPTLDFRKIFPIPNTTPKIADSTKMSFYNTPSESPSQEDLMEVQHGLSQVTIADNTPTWSDDEKKV